VPLVRDAMFDPFEYLDGAQRDGLLKTDFRSRSARSRTTSLPRARAEDRPEDARGAGAVPGTEVLTIERCSGTPARGA
jgi:hypothetical protein